MVDNRNGMKQAIVKVAAIILAIIFINSSHLFADTTKPRILKSYISEDASFKPISLSFTDCINVKNEKNSFTLEDKKVTWSAAVKGAMNSDTKSRYAVYWYAPDGTLFEKQTPEPIFTNSQGAKASLLIDKEKMKSKTGLWKIEVTYKDILSDNKYFYLTESGTKEVTQDDINSLEARIVQNKPVIKVEEVVSKEKIVDATTNQPVVADIEKPKDTKASYGVVQHEKLESEAKTYTAKKKPLSEGLIKLDREIIDEASKFEELIYQRGALYENEEVEAYMNKIAEKLLSNSEINEPLEIKIKMIRDPLVNAITLPNGSIYVHTGALARLENEAQLTFLLGHEISHVVNKDNLYDRESLHNKTVAYKLFDIVLAPTSVFFGILGDLAQLGFGLLYATSVTGYTREIEAKADKNAVLWASKLGYHPQEVANMIQVFLKEHEKYETGLEAFFLMNHPSNEWRLKKLKELIAEKYGDQLTGEIKNEEFLKNMVKIKLYNASLNMKMDRLEHAKDNIVWVIEKFPKNPEAHYLAGEIYRLVAEDKNKLKYELNSEKWRELNKNFKEGELEQTWRNKAMEEYTLAMECDPDYSNSYKGLGLLYYDKKGMENAIYNLKKYLAINNNAQDKRYILSLIERISKSEKEAEGITKKGGA